MAFLQALTVKTSVVKIAARVKEFTLGKNKMLMWALWSHTPVSSDTRRTPGFSKAGFCSRQESHLTFQVYLLREKATSNKQRVLISKQRSIRQSICSITYFLPHGVCEAIFLEGSPYWGPG